MTECSANTRHKTTKPLENHPCFSEKAQQYFSRIHLPVAPKCNIQCKYCNRKYDCSNESRPGVTSKVLSPEEALQKLSSIASNQKELSVVGIAGPGDALANPEKTFTTFRLIREKMPDLLLCLSTNGLNLVHHIDEIVELGIDHVTVTVNTFDPATAAKIYSWVNLDGKRSDSLEAMARLLERQQQGIKELVKANIVVKINSLLIPGINDDELKSLSKRLKLMGVSLHNIMPLICEPEHGTLFSKLKQPSPTPNQLEEVRKSCGLSKQMTHCRQCRADAVGKLNGTGELNGETKPNKDLGYSARTTWRDIVANLLEHEAVQSLQAEMEDIAPGPLSPQGKVAVCTTGTGFADLEMAKTNELYIYELINDQVELLNIRKVTPDTVIEGLEGCKAILSSKIGYSRFHELEEKEILPFTDLSHLPIISSVKMALKRVEKADTRLSIPNGKHLLKENLT